MFYNTQMESGAHQVILISVSDTGKDKNIRIYCEKPHCFIKTCAPFSHIVYFI